MNIELTKTQQYLEWLKDKLYLNAIAHLLKIVIFIGDKYIVANLVLA